MDLSGEQLEIAFGAARATVTSVGATLREYVADGQALVDGFDADMVCPGGRGQVLMPWPNRIASGRYEFAGRREQLPIDEVELGHAIHGLVRWAGWQVEARDEASVRLCYRLPPRPGYPWPLALSVEYRLAETGLTVTSGATNLGRSACPFGAGAHPYFRVEPLGRVRVDALELCVRAREWLDVDAHSIPTRRRPVEGSPVDFCRPRLIGTAHLDHAFTELDRDREGIARVRLRYDRQELAVWLDRSFGFVQIYTGDTLPDRSRRRLAVAVEPTSCAPNAFNSHDGLIVLEPGASFQGRWGVIPPR